VISFRFLSPHVLIQGITFSSYVEHPRIYSISMLFF
jgi:hypothetical protein